MSGWLVDTHALLWFLADDTRLSPGAAEVMRDGDIYASAVSIWEIAIKAPRGRIEVPDDFIAAVVEEGIETLNVTFEHAWRVAALPRDAHRDPFDRLLAAQALVERLPIISADSQFEQYGVERVW